MDNLAGLLTTIFAVTTILAAAIAGLVWGVVRTLRESNADLRGRVADLESKRAEDHAQIAELRADNAALGRLKTGEAHWTALRETLTQHHKQAQSHWGKEEALLMAVADELRRLEHSVEGRGHGTN